MSTNISTQVISFIYILTLAIVYFTKRKYNFLESKVYKILLVLSGIILLVDISNILIIKNNILESNLCIISSKIYYILIIGWVLLFLLYVYLNKTDTKYDNLKNLFTESKFFKIYSFLLLIILIISIFSSINYTLEPFKYYGNLITLYNIISIISILFMMLLIVIKKNTSNNKSWFVFISVTLLLIVNIFQLLFFDISILGSGISLITLFIYFTLENPDLRYVDELNILKIKAEEANKAKTYFLASMSHEIRTPMNAIICLSDSLLQSENLPLEITEDIKNINNAGTTLLEIINNILDITKIEEGKTEKINKPYDLSDILSQLRNITMISLSEKPIKFEINVIGNVPKKLNGDSVKLYQILMNVLSNAVKYTNKGTIKMNIESINYPNKCILTFKIIDTGIGIKKSDYNRVFQEFDRLDQEQKNIQGSGLGLSLTKKLVDILGGKITFESEYQVGTTFTITLEQEIISNHIISHEDTNKIQKNHVENYFDGSNYNILLVDDNALNLKVAEKLLKKYNFNITSISSGLECLNYTKRKKYDLILLDHMMPEMDGIHTLYNLRNRAEGFNTPVVVLTANAVSGSKKMYLSEGFCDYLSKPINQVELDRVLRTHLKIDEKN